jgi:hypothetical protein
VTFGISFFLIVEHNGSASFDWLNLRLEAVDREGDVSFASTVTLARVEVSLGSAFAALICSEAFRRLKLEAALDRNIVMSMYYTNQSEIAQGNVFTPMRA